ncbi:hypothetical protein [Spirosoma arcticum]
MNADMILVFRTSLRTKRDCQLLAPLLDSQAGIDQWTVDLADCDNVLRVVSAGTPATTVETMVRSIGFDCCELTD